MSDEMFSGIVEAVATVSVSNHSPEGRFCFETQFDIQHWLAVGSSIAIDGVCLTATEVGDRHFCVTASDETLSCTTLGELTVGSKVNLEPALAVSDRLGGHFVSGHVDGVGTIATTKIEAQSHWFGVEAPAELMKYIAPKGSVCIDGISLVTHRVKGQVFYVNLIPHTLAMTTLSDKRVGDRVNIEVDLLVRYLERLMEVRTNG